MKKIMILLFSLLVLVSCAKESRSVTVTNLSGIDWYQTQVWFVTNIDELDGYTEVGTVEIGSSCKVRTDCPMLYISAKDNNGKMIMSHKKSILYSEVTIHKSDLY